MSASDFTTLCISVSRRQHDFVEAEAARSGTTTSEYMQRLIHDALKRAAQEELERRLLEGLDSGGAIEVDREYWKRKRRDLEERHAKRSS